MLEAPQKHSLYSALLVISAGSLVSGCTKKAPQITRPFKDSFERRHLGGDYRNTGGPYRIVEGQLSVQGAYNHPLWLKRRLPRDAVIEFDVTSKSRNGDIKVEVWGDGVTHARNKGAYMASSYVLVFGGWGNQISALCRLDEHGGDRKERRDIKVQPNKKYHWKVKRKAKRIEWWIDGALFLSMDDEEPLQGPRHAYFGFNNWQSEIYFDNLSITPL